LTGAVTCGALTATTGHFDGLLTADLGLTVTSGQTLTLTGVTVTGLTQASCGGLTTADGPTFDHLHITNAVGCGALTATTIASVFASTVTALGSLDKALGVRNSDTTVGTFACITFDTENFGHRVQIFGQDGGLGFGINFVEKWRIAADGALNATGAMAILTTGTLGCGALTATTVAVNSGIAAAIASTGQFDYNSGAARWFATGAGGSTKGNFSLIPKGPDGSTGVGLDLNGTTGILTFGGGFTATDYGIRKYGTGLLVVTGDNSAAADLTCGALTATGGFGCNGKTAQAVYASGGLLTGVVAALVANGILSN